jgi:asparagine N-glycosylation enzyme membrane subunit Stt3
MLKDIFKDILRIKNFKEYNIFTILSILILLAGLIHWFYWISRYGVIYDVGIYSLTVVLVLGGFLGIIISLKHSKEVND